MDLIINDLQIPVEKDGPDEPGRIDQYVKAASLKTGIGGKNLSIVKILSKELDLRNKKQLLYKISMVVRSKIMMTGP